MDSQRFDVLMDEVMDELRTLRGSKGRDYATDDDALSNFKDAARQLGISPLMVWVVYAHKHWTAITSYCGRGDGSASEPIEGRIDDLILYLMLLRGLIIDAAADTASPLEQLFADNTRIRRVAVRDDPQA